MSKPFFERVPGDTGPNQQTRLKEYVLNGDTVPLPDVQYLEQVKRAGAAFFAAAVESTDVSLTIGARGPLPLTALQADRLLELLMQAETKPGDDELMEILRRAAK